MKKIVKILGLMLSMLLIVGCGNKEEVIFKSKYSPAITSSFQASDKYYNFKAKTADEFFVRADNLVSTFGTDYMFDLAYQSFNDISSGKIFSYGGIPVGKSDAFTIIGGTLSFKEDEKACVESYMCSFTSGQTEYKIDDKMTKLISIISEGIDKNKLENEINTAIKDGKSKYEDNGYEISMVKSQKNSKDEVSLLIEKIMKYNK